MRTLCASFGRESRTGPFPTWESSGEIMLQYVVFHSYCRDIQNHHLSYIVCIAVMHHTAVLKKTKRLCPYFSFYKTKRVALDCCFFRMQTTREQSMK